MERFNKSQESLTGEERDQLTGGYLRSHHGVEDRGVFFAEEGDNIITADLYWENYDLVFCNAYGAELKFFNFFNHRLFGIDSFRQTINAGSTNKKIVLLNFPNNPSGYGPSKDAAKEIIDVLKEAAEVKP